MDEHEFLGHFIIWVICFALATLEGKESGISLITAVGTSLIIFIPIELAINTWINTWFIG